MHNAVTRSYDLTALGVRAYFTPGRDNDTPEESEFSYYSHSHPYYELHLIRNGSVVLQTGSLRHNLDQDTFCLVCPDISHGLKSSVLGVRRCCIGLTIIVIVIDFAIMPIYYYASNSNYLTILGFNHLI